MKFHRFAKCTFALAALIISSAVTALAQCAMCKANVANAENAAEVSTTINAAVLVLLIPTLLIIGGVVRLVFKYRHSPNSYVPFRPSDTQRNSQ
jgi:heme/copper-type cytochrome/quinol oxidase subunit 2